MSTVEFDVELTRQSGPKEQYELRAKGADAVAELLALVPTSTRVRVSWNGTYQYTCAFAHYDDAGNYYRLNVNVGKPLHRLAEKEFVKDGPAIRFHATFDSAALAVNLVRIE